MTRKTSFYYSFLVLPSAERRAITAVFDVCRAIDDAVDLETDPARALKALESWRAEVARIFYGAQARGAAPAPGGGSPQTAQGRALQPFVKPFHLPSGGKSSALQAEPWSAFRHPRDWPLLHRLAMDDGSGF